MKSIVFWLEYPLFHIAPLIRDISFQEGVSVTVITEFDIPQWRLDMGFSMPDFGLAKEVFCPNKKIRTELLAELSAADSYHVFHGLRHVKENFKCFKKLVETDAYIGLYFEPQPLTGNLKAHFRKLYYRFLILRYRKRIDFMLALGDLGAMQYIDLGLSPQKTFPFEYHFDCDLRSKPVKQSSETLTFLYAGQLVTRKNIALVIDAVKSIVKQGYSSFELLIIGSGTELESLKERVIEYKLEKIVFFLNSMSNNQLHEYYLKADVFILPSKFEGWGAVATEAMAFGLPLIISDGCASSCIVKDDYHGFIFANNSVKSLEEKLTLFIENANTLVSDDYRKKRIKYAEKNLSGKAGSKKLLYILNEISNRQR